MRQTFDEHIMDLAQKVASRSRDTTKVGCIIVDQDKVIVSTGYNGLPRSVIDLPERMERPAKYLWTSHAEENAVAQAARSGARLLGSKAYVTHAPCARCARILIQAGVQMVCVGNGSTSMPDGEFEVAAVMFMEAGVVTQAMEPVG